MFLNCKFKAFSINLNAQNVNGMTLFDLAITSGKLVKNTRTVIRYFVVPKVKQKCFHIHEFSTP